MRLNSDQLSNPLKNQLKKSDDIIVVFWFCSEIKDVYKVKSETETFYLKAPLSTI